MSRPIALLHLVLCNCGGLTVYSMLRDIEHLSTRLGKIEGFGDLSEYLIKIVKSKDVRPSTPPPAPSPSAEEGKEGEKEGEQGEAKEDEARKEKSPSPEDPVEKEEMGSGEEEKGA